MKGAPAGGDPAERWKDFLRRLKRFEQTETQEEADMMLSFRQGWVSPGDVIWLQLYTELLTDSIIQMNMFGFGFGLLSAALVFSINWLVIGGSW